jgi:hypothetical protein
MQTLNLKDIKNKKINTENKQDTEVNFHKISIALFLFSTFLLISVLVYKLFIQKNNNEYTKVEEIKLATNTINTTASTSDVFKNFETEKERIESKKDWYTASYEYPKGNEFIKNKIENVFKDWIKENEGDIPGLKKINPNPEYTFAAKYKTGSSSTTKSYIYDVYSFTGGAHGGISLLPYTFSADGKELSIESILPTNRLQKVSQIAFVEIQKQRKNKLFEQKLTSKEVSESLKDTSWVKEGTAPTRDNYNTVWLEGDVFVIYFGQYQVASYAEGDFEVRIPISEI